VRDHSYEVKSIEPMVIFVFVQNILFSLFLGFAGIWNENFLQIIGYFLLKIESLYKISIILTTGSLHGKFGTWEDVDTDVPFDPAVRYVCGAYLLSFFVQLCLFPAVYKAMGWRFYRTIGTDITLKKLYQTYQALVMALQIDLQQALRGIIVMFWFVSNINQFSEYLWFPIVILILELVWIIAIRKGVISESKPLLISGVVCSLLSLSIWATFFVIFKKTKPDPDNAIIFKLLSGQVALVAWYIFISRSLSVIMSIISLKNFSKGLKDRAFPKLSIEAFMGGSLLHPFREIESDELKTRLSEQHPRESEIAIEKVRKTDEMSESANRQVRIFVK
jgi:hypothetical protein